MKRLLVLALAAGSALTVYTPAAEAAPTCVARSRTGSYGIGYGYNFYQARRLALSYCAANTPRGYTCYIRGCRY